MAERRLTEAAPDIAVGRVDLENGAQILDRGREGILCSQDAGDALHGRHRPLVEFQGLFVALYGAVVVLHLFGEGA